MRRGAECGRMAKPKAIKPHRDRWEQGYAALSKFRAREGHCCPSRHHIEGKYSLGPWVTTQRYCKEKLSAERKRRLDAIGFVWNWRDYLWERGFTSLLKFKRRERHCHVPIFHREGKYRLGYWVSTQRRNRNELSAERKVRLNEIGFVWREVKGAIAHRAARRRSLHLPVSADSASQRLKWPS
jgi:hypothetical protein